MLQRMKKNDANVNIPSYKKKFIIMIAKRTGQSSFKKNQWIPFHSILEHTACIIETDISLIILLLKVVAMFQIRLF